MPKIRVKKCNRLEPSASARVSAQDQPIMAVTGPTPGLLWIIEENNSSYSPRLGGAAERVLCNACALWTQSGNRWSYYLPHLFGRIMQTYQPFSSVRRRDIVTAMFTNSEHRTIFMSGSDRSRFKNSEEGPRREAATDHTQQRFDMISLAMPLPSTVIVDSMRRPLECLVLGREGLPPGVLK
jgi:hypothetical protein